MVPSRQQAGAQYMVIIIISHEGLSDREGLWMPSGPGAIQPASHHIT